jgi:hypothetical protein
MGGKALVHEDGKYTVTFVLYGPKTQAQLNRFQDEMDAFFAKNDARNVVEQSHAGPEVIAEKAASKKWGEG